MKFRFNASLFFALIFVIFTIAAVAIIGEKAVKIRKLFKVLEPGVESAYQSTFASSRKESWMMDIQQQMLEGKNIQEELCRLEIEEGTDRVKVAAAYNCLMQIYAQSPDELQIYKAIEFGSYALEVAYKEEYAERLKQIINAGVASGDSQLGQDRDEIAYLEHLGHSDNQTVAMRALNRLSMIYKLGRTSSLQQRKLPDMKAALAARNKMMSYFANYPKNKKVDIAVIVNDGYAIHAGVTIASAMLNANPDTFYNFYFVENPDDQISAENKTKLMELKKLNNNSEIIFKPFPNEYIENNLFKKHNKAFKDFPHLVAYRLFLDHLFPELDEIIYLDGDMIVKRDLNELKKKNSPDYSLAAVEDPEFIKNTILRECIEMDLKTYVNVGLMVLNLDKIRRDKSAQATMDAISQYKCQLHFFDQDTFNYVYKGKMKTISPRWNMGVGIDRIPQGGRNGFAEFITHFIMAPKGIRHGKPWLYPNAEKTWKENPEQLIDIFWDYWAYRDITPWKVRG
jgi:lipopolysaccharide biosynthesis glycosyltransferase